MHIDPDQMVSDASCHLKPSDQDLYVLSFQKRIYKVQLDKRLIPFYFISVYIFTVWSGKLL